MCHNKSAGKAEGAGASWGRCCYKRQEEMSNDRISSHNYSTVGQDTVSAVHGGPVGIFSACTQGLAAKVKPEKAQK
jgi:hypothetical protein